MNKCFTVILAMFLNFNTWGQDLPMLKVKYAIFAEGKDAPTPNLHITCYNKYFNQDYLSADFSKMYNLNKKEPYKKKILMEIFRNDISKKGLEKIELVKVEENIKSLIIEYKFVNADTSNDEKSLSPFLIIQVPKSKEKVIFIADGVELSNAREIYVD